MNKIEDISVWLKRLSTSKKFYPNKSGIIYQFDGRHRFLSNFYKHNITFENDIYVSSEHAFQAAKCPNTEEGKQYKRMIMGSETPGKAKKIGRECPIREDWDKVKVRIMREILRIKFSDHYLQDLLFSTDNDYLIEGTLWHDNVWGICILKDCPKCKNQKGHNHLGEILMEVREENRRE